MPSVFRDITVPDFYINQAGVRTVVPIVTAVIAEHTANYTIIDGDAIILVDASAGEVIITMPAITLQNNYINIKKIDTTVNRVLIVTPGAETIDGDVEVDITAVYESLQFVSDGSNWFVI